MKINWQKTISTSIFILAPLLVSVKYLALWIGGGIAVYSFIFGIIVLCLLVLALFSQIVLIIAKRLFGLKNFIPIIITILCLWITLSNPLEWLIEKTKSPVILNGYCEHTVTTVSIKLRENSTCEYNAGAFLKNETYKGTYIIKNDSVILNFKGLNPDNVADTLIYKEKFLIEIGDTTRHRHHFIITTNRIK
jgi:hypothetical protein